MPQPPASTPKVIAGVALALAVSAIPFGFKTVRQREQKVCGTQCSCQLTSSCVPFDRTRCVCPHTQVHEMRDAAYGAKDEARNERLQGPVRKGK